MTNYQPFRVAQDQTVLTKLLFSQQTGDASQALFRPPMTVMGEQLIPLQENMHVR